MDSNKTLREIYDYDLIPDDDMECTSDEWFNMLMDKKPGQLTVADVCRMLRQKIFSVVAIEKAINILYEEPFAGDMYEGQLLGNLLNAKEKYLAPRYPDVEDLIEKLTASAEARVWEDEDDKSEYFGLIEEFRKKIREASL